MYSKKITNYEESVLLYLLEVNWCEDGMLSFDLVTGRTIQLEKNRQLILIIFIDGKCVFILLHKFSKTSCFVFFHFTAEQR